MSSNTEEKVNTTENVSNQTEKREKVTNIPQGMLKSGRVWKSNQTKKSSQFATNGVAHIKTDWELKQEKRLKDQRTKELQKSMKEAKAEAQRQKRQHIEEQRARRIQNEIKAAQVQIISNTGKLKKMSKKQLKQLKKTRIDKNGNVEYILSLSTSVRMQNPQEQRQELLIKRVINSIDRLCSSLSDLTNQMEAIQQYSSNIDYLHAIWKGYESKMNIHNQIH